MEIRIEGFLLKMRNTEGTIFTATNRNNLRMTVRKSNDTWYADLKIVSRGHYIFSTCNKDLGDLLVRIGYLVMDSEPWITEAEHEY